MSNSSRNKAEAILKWFDMADVNSDDNLDYEELEAALKNDESTHFRPETCRALINMFDTNKDKHLDRVSFKFHAKNSFHFLTG